MVFVSYEPMLSVIPFYDFSGIDWLIVGALTGHIPQHEFLPRVEIRYIIKNIIRFTEDIDIPLFIKNNLKPIYNGKLIQEFPHKLVNVKSF